MSENQTESNTTNPTPNSTTKDYPNPILVSSRKTHGLGLWGNPRKVVSIRVDSGLYSAFKPVAKRVFGSTCNPIESFMASVIACAETGVNFGNTIEVGHITIERNLARTRRDMRLEPSEVEAAKCSYCEKPAVAIAQLGVKGRVFVCELHRVYEKAKLRKVERLRVDGERLP